MDEFLRMARFGLEALYRQVAGMGYVLLLTDSNGVTVDFIGDPTFDNHLRRAGLYLGADWNEGHAGTCAVGTCIATAQALTVHQTDHFDATHIPLTCTAAPVFDSGGELAAVLDISALHSPEPKISQYLALQMVRALIELSGHEVLSAGDGTSGLQMLVEQSVDVAVVDIGLPGLDGLEVAQRARAAGVSCLIVALTGYGQPKDVERTRAAGFDVHLVYADALRQSKRVAAFRDFAVKASRDWRY